MSNKTFNARNNKAKKGISPVIATVILVAVAVVIAAALAGFSSSLFGTYASQGGSIQVKTISVSAQSGVASIELVNGGNVADAVTSVQALPNQPQTAFSSMQLTVGTTTTTPTNSSIPPSGSLSFDADVVNGGNSFNDGQTITVKITMQSGLQLTQSVVITA